jgi:hypothetical protein
MSEYGSVVWPSSSEPIWTLNYSLEDAVKPEGIAVTSVNYRGHRVFAKASLPSLRVQYDANFTGPYKDPLHYGNAQFTSGSPTKKVSVYSYTSGGLRCLVLESFHQIGWYKLIQRWHFWENGVIYPRLYSSGIIEHKNHTHHVYWRFDFDIDTTSNNIPLEYNTYNGWQNLLTETVKTKYPPSNRTWAIMNKTSPSRGYMITPGPNDGMPDNFSVYDLWVLRYQPSEDRFGNQGSAYSDDLGYYLNWENTDGQDIVFWYCAHLRHVADGEHGDEWHSAGPNLTPFRY